MNGYIIVFHLQRYQMPVTCGYNIHHYVESIEKVLHNKCMVHHLFIMETASIVMHSSLLNDEWLYMYSVSSSGLSHSYNI